MGKNELLELIDTYSQKIRIYEQLSIDQVCELAKLADNIVATYNSIKGFVNSNPDNFEQCTIEYINSDGFCGEIKDVDLFPLISYKVLKIKFSEIYAKLAQDSLLRENESLFVLNAIKSLNLYQNSDIFKALIPMFQNDESSPHILARIYEKIFNLTNEAEYAKFAGLIWADKVRFPDGALENLKKYVEIQPNDSQILWKISDICGNERLWQEQVKYMAMAIRNEAKNA